MSSRDSNEAHMRQKRARSQLSCTACRHGKLRCNRAAPCDQCTKRSKESACSYLAPAARVKGPQDVKGRIQHLEQLVVDLMNSRSSNGNGTTTSSGRSNSTATSVGDNPTTSQSDHSPLNTQVSSEVNKAHTEISPPYSDENSPIMQHPQEAQQQLESFGHLRISKEGTSYVGTSHWATILDSISEIKRELEDSSDGASDNEYDAWRNEEPLNAYDEELPGLLRSPRRVTKAELLSFIPAKAEADALVSLWFRAPHPYKIVLHAPQFQNEYRQFWRSQTSAPVMWLGVLYGMFGMATLFKIRALGCSDPPMIRALMQKADLYQELAASAAVLGNYMKPKTYTIECLLLHAGSNKSNDYSDLWVLMGVFFRLALHMGYHRDPSHYKNVSVLDAEMRRRVWHLLYMLDTIVSFQLGLPAMLRTVQSDTRLPSNLYDQDFSIHSKTLPPPRPIEQLTPSAYIASKFSLCEILALAADVSHAPTAPSYTKVMELDARFETIRAALPPGLQFIDLQLCLIEDPESLMCRFGLDLLCLKIKVVLHRRFMVATASQAAVPYSRISVIGSAMRTLEHHRTIYRASCPGGQLESVSWYMCSIGTYDFLLASMIICLELAHQLNKQPDPETDKIATREDMIAALEASKQIWEEAGKEVYFSEPAFGTSRSDQAVDNTAVTEIRKACRAMTIMLNKVRKDQVKNSLPPAMISEGSIPMPAAIPMKDEWSATDNWIDQNDFSNLDNIMNVSNDIDWEMWDQQLSQQQAVNPQPLPEQFTWTIDDMLAASAPGIPMPDMSLGDYPDFL